MKQIKVRLTKISDDKFSDHGNGLIVGQQIEGSMIEKPTIGKRFELVKKKIYLDNEEVLPVFSTSVVQTEINNNGLFKTEFSTYKLEPLE